MVVYVVQKRRIRKKVKIVNGEPMINDDTERNGGLWGGGIKSVQSFVFVLIQDCKVHENNEVLLIVYKLTVTKLQIARFQKNISNYFLTSNHVRNLTKSTERNVYSRTLVCFIQ